MSGLCYSAPAHESWNLAHICRLIPESHTLFATPAGCSRIVRLSAIEKGFSDIFTTLDITSADIIDGGVEEKILKGTRETINALKEEGRMPKAMLLFISCVDTFIGTDHEYYLEKLKSEFPDIYFLDCAMDPINREILPPIARMHLRISEVFTNLKKQRAVNFIGSFIAPDKDNELIRHLAENGIESKHIYNCTSISEAESMGGSMLNIVLHPTGVYAAKDMEKRTGIPGVLMPQTGDLDEQDKAYGKICSILDIPNMDLLRIRKQTEEHLSKAACRAKDIAISQDAYVMPCILANRLGKYGFNIKKIFLNETAEADKEAFKKAVFEGINIVKPDELHASAYKSGMHTDTETVGIGGEAAYYLKTSHSVSRIAFGGDFGYHSLKKLADDIVYAKEHKRDLNEITLPGKGCCCL